MPKPGISKTFVWRTVAVLAIAICLIELWLNGFEARLGTRNSCFIEIKLAEDLWFASSGEITTVRREGSKIFVEKWTRDCKRLSEATFDFAAAVPDSSRSLDPRYSLKTAFLDEGPRPRTWFPYAVSSDGSKIAWLSEGKIRVEELGVATGAKHSFNPNAGVVALSFSQPSAISLIDDRGQLAHWNYVSGKKWQFATPLTKKWVIWNRGSNLLLSLFEQQSIALFNLVGPGDEPDNKVIPGWVIENASTLALAPSRKLAVGTLDGVVAVYALSPKGFTRDGMFYLKDRRPVRALAFGHEGLIFAGGDFGKVYALIDNTNDATEDEDPQAVLPVREASRFMAASSTSLAVSTPGEIIVAEVDRRLKMLKDDVGVRISIYSCLIALIALFEARKGSS